VRGGCRSYTCEVGAMEHKIDRDFVPPSTRRRENDALQAVLMRGHMLMQEVLPCVVSLRAAQAKLKTATAVGSSVHDSVVPNTETQQLVERLSSGVDGVDAGLQAARLGLITATYPAAEILAKKCPANTIDAPALTECVECAECDNLSHFICGICYTTCWSDGKSSLALPCCNNQYCGSCWARWVSVLIEAGTTNISTAKLCLTPSCPPPGRDHACVTKARAGFKALRRGLLCAEEKRDLQTLITLDVDMRARQCPSCKYVTTKRDNMANMICERNCCGLVFCAFHGNLHPNETCNEFRRRTPMDPSRMRYARAHHTKLCPHCGRSIVKNGGCDHMRCVCGTSFNWSSARVEVPCACLNLRDHSKKCVPWGAPPCPGASPIAYIKLTAWRCLLGTLASPVLAIGAAVALPGACIYTWQLKKKSAQHLVARYRGLTPGTFQYNYMIYGEGRRR